jgi:hypothetical protein
MMQGRSRQDSGNMQGGDRQDSGNMQGRGRIQAICRAETCMVRMRDEEVYK